MTLGSNGSMYFGATNQKDIENIDMSDKWYSTIFYHDTYAYKYTEAKTAEKAVKVGNWVINYGSSIKDVTATYVD